MAVSDREYIEKRGYIRMNVDFELEYRIIGSNQVHKGLCVNLSHTGIKFKSSREAAIGSLLDVTIDLRDDKFKPMKARYIVLRIEPSDDGNFLLSCRMRNIK